MQSTMTDNSVGNIVYDSGSDTLNGRKRIGISATEIELLDDLPLTPGSGLTSPRNNVSDRTRGFSTQIPPSSSSNAKQKQQTTYQTLSLNREQFKPNVIYQDENNEQLNFAVDQLLEKYAPDAIPQNLLNTKNNRQAPSQVNVITARDQPPVSTFQTTTQPPPSSSSTITHNYSTIIRPNTGQTSQTQKQPQINNNNNNNSSSIGNGQTSTRSQPVANYDSFQHVIPPTQQQQQQRQPQLQQQPQQQQQQQQQQQPQQQQQQKQQQFQKTIPIKTKSGQLAQVVPGKLYNFDDDPLHLLYDRQITAPSNPPKPIFNTTFQPSNNFQTVSNPSTVIYTNTTQRFPQQSIPTTTNPNSNGIEPFNLGNLIKRVQQEYQREIQPFVSSVRFVEKDREYGQSLADVGFITPVTVRKGFSRQADDILRHSFGRQEHSRSPTRHRSEDNTYSEDDDEDEDDDISDLRPTNHQHRLEKFDSKQSFTSVTSVSTTTSSDNDDRYTKLRNRTNPVEVHNQETSPPPQVNQTQPQPQTQVPKISVTAADVSPKPVAKNETDDDNEEEETTTPVSTAPLPVTPAKRIPSDQHSDTSSGSTISDDEENRPAAYNEHELPQDSQPKPTDRVQALATITPVVKPDDATRERLNNIANQATQRSEDIHPTPPIIRPTQTSNNRTQVKTDTEESDGIPSGSDNVSDSDDEERSATYNEQPQAPSTARPTAPQNTFSTPTTRGPTTQQTSARLPATTTTQNQFPTSRTTTDNNTRQAAGAGTTPNIHFVPPDQRSGINDRGGPATSTNQPTVDAAQTGSNRFFQSDNNPKPGAKRSTKDGPASIGDKIKSFFRRK